MAILNYPNQLNFIGKGYIDPKIGKVVSSLEELKKIGYTSLFQGLTVIVLDDGEGFGPSEYWIPGADKKWVKKFNFGELKLVFDSDFQTIQLQFGEQLLNAVELADLFEDKFIEKAELAKEDGTGKKGTFIKFTYSGKEGDKKVDFLDLTDELGKEILIDAKSLEYAEDGKTLGVKTAAPALDKEGNAENAHIEKTDAGLGIAIPITGDDVGTEIE